MLQRPDKREELEPDNIFAQRRRVNLLVMRDWQLPCDDCDHVGEVRATIQQIRRWVAEEKLVCSECGSIKHAFRSA